MQTVNGTVLAHVLHSWSRWREKGFTRRRHGGGASGAPSGEGDDLVLLHHTGCGIGSGLDDEVGKSSPLQVRGVFEKSFLRAGGAGFEARGSFPATCRRHEAKSPS